LKVICKVWLDNNGKVFGEGPYLLLKKVQKSHSLHQAANEMGMSYSKAWRLIRTIEQRLGFLLLERRTGGRSGGGSEVTPEGKKLMKNYEKFQKDIKEAIEKIYQKHFCSNESILPLQKRK